MWPRPILKSNEFAANFLRSRRYILTISPLASYDSAVNKLMFSPLFPYIFAPNSLIHGLFYLLATTYYFTANFALSHKLTYLLF